MRVGIKEPDDDEEGYYNSQMWYHPDCLKKCMPELGLKKAEAESFYGFTYLRPADKKKLKMMCGETDEADDSAADTGKGKGFVLTQTKLSACLDRYT